MAGKSDKEKNTKKLERFKPRKEKIEWQKSEFMKKLARHRLDILVRAAICILVLALATLFFYLRYVNKVYTGYSTVYSVANSIYTGTDVMRYGNNFLVYGRDGMKCINNKGEQLWNETFQMQKPMIDICSDVIGVADYNGSTVHVLDSSGPVMTVDTGMPIRKFRVSAKKQVVTILDDDSITPISLYNSVGEKRAIFKTSMHDSGYPLDIALSDNGELVGVSFLGVDKGAFKTNVAFYNFGEVGKNETDNLVSGYTYAGAVVPEIDFVSEGKAVAVADNRLMFYSGNQKPASNGEVLVSEEIQGVFCGEEHVALIFRDSESDYRYRADIFDGNGKKKDSAYFDMDYIDAFFDKDRFVIYGSNDCLIHKIGGIDKFRGTFDKSVLLVMPTGSSNKFVIVTQESIDGIELE